MPQAKGFRQVGYLDCPGGGQVVVDGTTAYVGHMKGPEATSVIDVSDPAHPRITAQFNVDHPSGVHSHKVRAKNGLMVVNVEGAAHIGKIPDDYVPGLKIYDSSDPKHPKYLTTWRCARQGVHRFTFDGRYVYLSPCVEGYLSNIVMILDLKDPMHPQEIGRWCQPGQWEAGGETPSWKPSDAPKVPRCHHPIRMGDRLYTSYWHGGFHIIDISDMTKPKTVSSLDWTPVFGYPVHTCLPIPFEIGGRKLMMVTDEDALPRWQASGSMVWMVDITDETKPIPISTLRIGHDPSGKAVPMHSTCHQPAEDVKGTEIPVVWFDQGLRMIDISDPHAMREVAYYVPDPHPTGTRVQSNDCCWDDRGLIYVIDRIGGVSIVERC